MVFVAATCYVSPRLEGRTSVTEGRGLFALEPIQAGELLVVWGGDVITLEHLQGLDEYACRITLQVEDTLYLITTKEGPGDWVNHSCQPNAGLQGQITLVAMQSISPGEEIHYDYAMSEASGYDEFRCLCQTSLCRQWVRGKDWQRPELQARYKGFFSPYIQRKIDKVVS